jgi:hypothetical protein
MSSQPVCPPCNESPLSITANIIAIITFVYVLLIGVSYRAREIAQAAGDIQNITIEAETRRAVFDHWLKDPARARTPIRESAIGPAREEIHRLFSQLSQVIPGLWTQSGQKWYVFWIGWKFVHSRDRLKESLERFDALFESVKALAHWPDE